MRKAFAVAATLAVLAACDAFEGSNDAKTSGDAGLDATATSADGSTSDAQAPHFDAAVLDAAGGFCAEANLSGRTTLGCEDFEDTDASHGFVQEMIGLTVSRSPVAFGRAPNGLVVNGTLNGSNAVGGIAYQSSLGSKLNVRLRFMLRVIQLAHSGELSDSHVQIAGIFYGGASLSVRLDRGATAAAMSTTVAGTPLEEATRTLGSIYEVWVDVIHQDAGGLRAQVSIDQQPIGEPQPIAEPVDKSFLARVGAQLDGSGDSVHLEIDDVLLQQLP